MKKNIFLPTLAATLITAGVAASINASSEKKTPDAPLRGKFFQHAAERLELSADQKSQIKAIVTGEKAQLQTLLTALHDARKEMRAAIHAGDANEKSVRATAAKAASADADLAVERMKIYAKIAPVLTDAQRAKITELETRLDEFSSRAIAQFGPGLEN